MRKTHARKLAPQTRRIELRREIENVRTKIDELYKIAELENVCYRLHSVLVHEGEATGGHYWVYIRDHVAGTWRKFNDVSVTSVMWDEVRRISFGTHHTASAYCLFYINEKEASRISNNG